MRQVGLMQITSSMKIGQAICLTEEDMLGCADGMLRSAFDGPPRQRDIDDFIKAWSENWGVRFTHDPLRSTWTMLKIRGDSTR